MNNNIIGNTPLAKLNEIHFAEHNTETALKIGEELEKAGVKCSGKVKAGRTTLAVNKRDEKEFHKAVGIVKGNKRSLMGQLNEKKELSAQLNASRKPPDKGVRNTAQEL